MYWGRSLRWEPRRPMWRIAVLFIVGSTCFAIGSFPFYFQLVPPQVLAVTFFVGSIFFTSAAALQWYQATVDRRALAANASTDDRAAANLNWWAGLVQFAGTLMFNLSTGDAMITNLDVAQVNQLVWAPDMYGSVAFLMASALAWVAVCGARWCRRSEDTDWWIAAINALGSVFFMVSAIAALTLPTTDKPVNSAVVNATTAVGAVCFWVGAWLLLPQRSTQTARSPEPERAREST